MPKSPYKPYTPNAEQMALFPEISGNTINGQGEQTCRRAEHVYWREPETLAHGQLQQWFYTQNPNNPLIDKARAVRQKVLDQELSPLAPTAIKRSAGEWTAALREFSETLELELFGITRLKKEWLFVDEELDDEWVVVIGVAHDYEEMKQAPEARAGAEVIRQYGRGAAASKAIASWFREQGWEATLHTGPLAGTLLMIPPAIECGFGELGKHGSIINERYGSSFRLACVSTNVPLLPTRARSYGVDDFCSRCQVCAKACPPEAILPEKIWVRGALKWYVDFDKCLPFFNENSGCGICVAVCPWSIPGRGPRIVEQLARRARASDYP